MSAMKSVAAIAVLEFESIAAGTRAADAMAKRAPLDVLRCGSVQPGKYVILVGGSVAAVEEAHVEGQRCAADSLADEVLLPDVHPQVWAALDAKRQALAGDTVGVFETSTIPSNVLAADRGVKAAEVTILEIRVGDGLGGKAVTHFSGELHEVQAAIEAARAAVARPGVCVAHAIIPRVDAALEAQLAAGTRFSPK